MFLSRTAQSLGKAFITHGSTFPVPANRLRNVTLTLPKVHASGALCLAAFRGHLTRVNHTKGQGKDVHLRDTSCGLTADRVATIATSLSKSIQSRGGCGDSLARQLGTVYGLHVVRSGVVGNAYLSGHTGLFHRHCSTAGTMHTTRASSTAAARQQPREEEQQQNGSSDKGDEQTLKDASASSEKPSEKPEPDPEGGKPNKTQQLKKVFKEYGAVGVSFHICISLMSLGMFYLLVSSGIDMAGLLCKLGFSEAVVKSKMAAGTSTFVLAYAIHKLFAPVRISITLVSVPLIVRYFRKIGLFKPPPTAP